MVLTVKFKGFGLNFNFVTVETFETFASTIDRNLFVKIPVK